jgi:hypothetical protein
MSGKRKRKFKRKRKIKEKRVAGGVPLAEISLSLRSSLDSLLGRIETIGASARSAARDHLTGHLYETIDRLCNLAFQKKDTVAAWRAAQTLSALVYRCINPLISIASVEQDTIGKRWAGESLARVYVAVKKHTKTLSRVNSAYREKSAKLQNLLRRNIVAPSLIGQIVQEELASGERYRDELLFYRRLFGKNWGSLIRTRTPRESRVTLKLPAFSVKSEGDWFRKWVWPRIKKRQAELLPKLRQGAKGRAEAKAGLLYLKGFQNQFRNHLKALAKLRGVR